MKRTHKKAARKKAEISVWKSALLALPLTLAWGLLLLLLGAALLMTTKDPMRYQGGVSIAMLLVTGLFGGICTARICRRRFPVLCGLLIGAELLLVLTVPALLLPKTLGAWGASGFLLRLLLFPLALAGAFLACRKKATRRRR